MSREQYLRWTTPAGFPWANRCYKQKTKQVRLYLHSLGVPFRVLLNPEIDKRKAKNGVAPNFVHACDAAHLMRTVNAAVAEGITSIATVHDSFGCLASRAERFLCADKSGSAMVHLAGRHKGVAGVPRP
jgi:DNA-directed RNA polymerase